MATEPESAPTESALGAIADHLTRLGIPFALVGGLAVSVRAEVRFTRDVDIAVSVATDADLESLLRELKVVGYDPVIVVEHQIHGRIATVRLRSRSGVIVDLIAASSGIEREIVERASSVEMSSIGSIRVARAEELLSMKVLSMTDRRLQDRIDAVNLVLESPALAIDEVRENLRLMAERGYDREQDLNTKLDAVLESASHQAE